MRFILFLLLSVLTWISVAQSKGLVYYGHIESPGKGGPVGLDFNAYLVFDKEASYYVTAKDSLENLSELENQKSKEVNGTKQVYLGKHTLTQGKQVYYNRHKDSLWWNKKHKEPVYGHEKRVKINWSFHPETKTFGGITAHKATGYFRGRTYTAWYTKKIPLPYGPWKLQGLPGLILEAYDEKKEMYIYFKSVEYPTEQNVSVTFIQRPETDWEHKWISIGEYQKLLEEIAERNKTKAILISKQMGGDVTVSSGGIETLSVEVFQ